MRMECSIEATEEVLSVRTVRMLWIAVCVAVMTAACAQDAAEESKGSSVEAAHAVLEVVLRDMLTNVASGEEVYVSFGTSWRDRVDPPAGFLRRFDDVPAALHPVSAYGGGRGRTPLLLAVHVCEEKGEAEVLVEATRYRLGVGAADGFTARVVRSDGGWTIAERADRWST
jgi:hypothetical protein